MPKTDYEIERKMREKKNKKPEEKKDAPSMLGKVMKEQRKQYPKPLTDKEKDIMRAMERGDEMYVDKETGQKISLPAGGLEAPDFMVDLLVAGGLAGLGGKLGKKAARALAAKLSKKPPRNVRVPRGKPGGGPLRKQDREAGRELRKDPAVRERKREVKELKKKKRRDARRVGEVNKLVGAVTRREALKQELEDLRRSLRQVLEEGNETQAAMFRREISDVEKRLRRQGIAKRRRAARRGPPPIKRDRPLSSKMPPGSKPQKIGAGGRAKKNPVALRKQFEGVKPLDKNRYGPEFIEAAEKHNEALNEITNILRRQFLSESDYNRVIELGEEIENARKALGSAALRAPLREAPRRLRKRRPPSGRPQDDPDFTPPPPLDPRRRN